MAEMAFPMRSTSPAASRRRLRELMAAPEAVALPGPYDALSAILLQQLGFDGLWAGGKVASGSSIGVGDLGLMTMTEQLRFCASLVDATELPVVADADDGYGGVLQVARTVQAFERAGVAALVIEDQAAPKHCAFYADFALELIDLDAMVGKVKTALDARLDSSMMIWARSDALAAGLGVDETLRRVKAYSDAGAEAIFVPCSKLEDLSAYASRWDGTALLVMSGVAFPSLTLAEAAGLGFAAKLDPSATVLAALKGVEEVMGEYRRTGSLAGARAHSKTPQEFEELVATDVAAEMEAAYLPRGRHNKATASKP
jgi:2,3-dimethylmalate lyase